MLKGPGSKYPNAKKKVGSKNPIPAIAVGTLYLIPRYLGTWTLTVGSNQPKVGPAHMLWAPKCVSFGTWSTRGVPSWAQNPCTTHPPELRG